MQETPRTMLSIGDLEPQEAILSLLAAIVESSDDAIISKNLNGMITSWNVGAERIFGYSAAEAVGKHISLIAVPGNERDMTQIIERIARNERVDHYETVRRHKDGREIRVSLSVSPIRNHLGVVIGASKIARDITAQRKSEELLQRNEKLTMMGRLAASVAHEIRNPLEAVTNIVYLLKDYSLPEQAQEYLHQAEVELGRASQIVSQTLAFHKLNNPPQPVELKTVLDSALVFLRSRLQEKQIAVMRKYRKAAEVPCMEGELRQVFINLLGNAIDAMQSRGRLVLTHRNGTDWHTGRAGIRVTVADSGSGISRETLAHLFEAFYSTKGPNGNGLGLWISSEIIRRHHGTIRIRSSQHRERHGTIFSIFLPEIQEAPADEQDPSKTSHLLATA